MSKNLIFAQKTTKLLAYAVKPVYNDHPLDPKIVTVVDRWSLSKGHFCNKSFKWGLKMVVVIDRWLLFGVGH